MAAGLGFKDFQTGEVLTAADVDGYLMQGVWVFASATARDAAVTSPQEGNFAYLKDTNVTTYYTGSAWANLDTTGMTNPMTTTGDTIYSSSGSTPARLGIGTAGQVLQVNSGATAPEWATPASGGGMTLLSTTTLSGASTSISITPTGYTYILALIKNAYGTSNNAAASFRLNSDTGSNYTYHSIRYDGASLVGTSNFNLTQNYNLMVNLPTSNATGRANNCRISIFTPNATDDFYVEYESIGGADAQGNPGGGTNRAIYNAAAALSNLTIFPDAGSFSGGTVEVYGVK
jgi:hypothetical protein